MGNMGAQHTYPPNNILADLIQIKTNKDAVKWLKLNFAMNEFLTSVIEDLEDSNFNLYDCSYKYSLNCDAINIVFRLDHKVTHIDTITSFQYYPPIKS